VSKNTLKSTWNTSKRLSHHSRAAVEDAGKSFQRPFFKVYYQSGHALGPVQAGAGG
jgi:hypothetical protein